VIWCIINLLLSRHLTTKAKVTDNNLYYIRGTFLMP
jgi:hypothetical protein